MARTGFAKTAVADPIDLGDLAAPIAIHDLRAPVNNISVTKHPRCAHVLVVDDNDVNRQLIEAIVHQLGYTVTLADSGAEALRLIDTATFDAILMDYEMPGMNGVETTTAIRAIPACSGIPVLAVSAHRGGLPPDAPAGLYDAAIEKPISIPALQAALDTAVHASTPSDTAASKIAQAG